MLPYSSRFLKCVAFFTSVAAFALFLGLISVYTFSTIALLCNFGRVRLLRVSELPFGLYSERCLYRKRLLFFMPVSKSQFVGSNKAKHADAKSRVVSWIALRQI